jgi:1,4-dihydroxy-6-naphthoate synthase
VSTTRIRLAHSPDSDDAFMFVGLSSGAIPTGELEILHELHDIETLNAAAVEGRYEITALSFHAWPHVAAHYDLMDVGASFGDGYGPLVVSREPMDLMDLDGMRVAIPGRWTTAALVTALAVPGHKPEVVAFDAIPEAVASGRVEAGVLIHEGQLTYGRLGLCAVADLGGWWHQRTGLPLPLGCNAVRRDLGPKLCRRLASLVRDSIVWGLEHRSVALETAKHYGRELTLKEVDRFVGMYVNDWTRKLGDRGRHAVSELLRQGAESGFIPAIEPRWVEAE